MRRLVNSLILLALFYATCAAQVNSGMGSPASANGALERVIVSEPFVADSLTEFLQTAADGSHVRHTSTATVARDSMGRTRYSQNLSLLISGTPRSLTIIRDPGAGFRYLIDSVEKVARKEAIPTGVAANANRSPQTWTARDAAVRIVRASIASMLMTHGAVVDQRSVVITQLGDRNTEGLTASGVSAAAEVPSGAIGNEKPLTFTSEAWFSNDLGIVVASRIADPLQGETSLQLKQIRRTEPSSDLFEVPAGYRIAVPDGQTATPEPRKKF